MTNPWKECLETEFKCEHCDIKFKTKQEMFEHREKFIYMKIGQSQGPKEMFQWLRPPVCQSQRKRNWQKKRR